MTTSFARKLVAVLLLCVARDVTLHAQRPALSLDLATGGAKAWTGDRQYVNDMQLNAALTLSVRPVRSSGGVLGASIGVQGSAATTASCDVAPGGSCLPEVPTVRHFGLLGGLERSRGAQSLRVTAGPAFYAGTELPSKLGGMLQFDASAGWQHVAFVVSARAHAVPFFKDDTFILGALGFGVRVR